MIDKLKYIRYSINSLRGILKIIKNLKREEKINVKNILKKVDKMLKEMRQETEVEVKTKVGLLNEIAKRAKGKQITLEAEGPQGRKEKLMVSERGISLLDKDRYKYDQMIDLTGGNKEEAIRIWANSPGSISRILQKALAGEVEIEIT